MTVDLAFAGLHRQERYRHKTLLNDPFDDITITPAWRAYLQTFDRFLAWPFPDRRARMLTALLRALDHS